MGNKGISFFSW